MTLYKFTVTPQGPACSRLQSGALFGAFCWSWHRIYGEAALLREVVLPPDNRPTAIFSDLFPRGCVPFPLSCKGKLTNFTGKESPEAERASYQKAKRLKKASYVSLAAALKLADPGFALSETDIGTVTSGTVVTMHSAVSRDNSPGGLYGKEQRFFAPGTEFDGYLMTELPKDKVTEALRLMFSVGIGADKSSGAGIFALTTAPEPDEKLFSGASAANAFLALSDFIPAASDPTDGQYQTVCKYQKLDGDFAGTAYPFKKPYLYVKAGSVFFTDCLRPWYGRCVTGVAAVSAPVMLCGCTIAMPIYAEMD